MPPFSRFRLLLVVATFVTAVACSNPAGPTPPPPVAAPVITCPADIETGATSSTTVVEYPLPQTTGGTAPVAVSCTMPSGAQFGLGTTSVACTASDSAARTAQCTFRVNVSLIPRLRGTKIVAFGDSITAGVVSIGFETVPLNLEPHNSYPTVLGRLLEERYRAQTITVINEGVPGESVVSAAPTGRSGEDRLEDVVLRHRPDVLIVLEGVNGLTASSVDDISEALRRGVRRAVRDGVPLVIVSTILPGLPQGTKPPDPEAVDALNDEIRWWAPRESAVLGDAYAVVAADPVRYIGKDGLHPTVDGYRRMAEHFFDVIRTNFELPPPAPAASSFPAGASAARRGRR